MKYVLIVFLCLALGSVFVFFPRGKEYITIYNNCTVEVCPQWFSAGVDVHYRGIPFKVDPAAFSTLLDDREPVTKNNVLKTGLNFTLGCVTGLALSLALIKKFQKKS